MRVESNTVTYNTLITACGKELGNARAVFHRMKAANLQPDTITYSALISACLGAGEWQEGLHFLQHMRLKQLVPNEATYNPLLNALWNSGQVRARV